MPACLFPHPKDFPGLIEFFDPALDPRVTESPETNPRRHPGWTSDYWRDGHPLGLVRASHVTLVTPDHAAAATAYADLFGVSTLPDQPARAAGCDASFVTFGPDTMIELAQPRDERSPTGRHLARIGTSWWGMTFTVADLDQAEEFLTAEHVGAPVERAGRTLRLDPAWMFGVEYAFTDEPLTGDPRV